MAAAFLGTLFRRPRRRDLVWLSGGLVAGVIAQAVLGGIVVYTKLNPYLVMVHFCATMVLLVNAVVLVHRSTRDYRPGVGPPARPAAAAPAALRDAAGAGVRDCCRHGHHGRRPARRRGLGQQVAKRIPIALRDMAELHSSLVLLLVGMTIGLVVGLHMADVPERVRRASRVMLGVMVAQAAVGYTQYFTHLPALLVEVHLIGVTTSGDRGDPVLPGVHLPSGRGGRGARPGGGGALPSGRRSAPGRLSDSFVRRRPLGGAPPAGPHRLAA